MLIVAFFQWWYGPGWTRTATQVLARVKRLYLDFSIPILLRTLLAPWRRIVTPSRGSFGERLRAMVDNTVSRFVGLIVRLLALITGLVLMTLTLLMGSLLVIIWPLLPPASLLLILGGLW